MRGSGGVIAPGTRLMLLPSTNSDIETPRTSDSFSTAPIRGCDQPVSHCVTVALVTPTRSASFACVKSASVRNFLMFSAKPMCLLLGG